jgi:hypothetical protein
MHNLWFTEPGVLSNTILVIYRWSFPFHMGEIWILMISLIVLARVQ